VLDRAEGQTAREVAAEVEVNPVTVGTWRHRLADELLDGLADEIWRAFGLKTWRQDAFEVSPEPSSSRRSGTFVWHREHRLGPVQRLDLSLFSTQTTNAASGGFMESPTTSRTFSMKRVFDSLNESQDGG